MTVVQKSAIVDYLVTFFVDKHISTRMLSEVVKHRDDVYYVKALGLPQNFTLPFFLEEEQGKAIYKISLQEAGEFRMTVSGKACLEGCIKDGDYITFKSSSQQITVSVLFIATNSLLLDYKKCIFESGMTVYIGRNSNNEISYNYSELVDEERHIVIMKDAEGNACIEDLKRTFGLYVNGKQVYYANLQYFDEIFFMGLSIVYLGNMLAIRNLHIITNLKEITVVKEKTIIDTKQKQHYFVRIPRIIRSLDTDVIEVDAPPSPQQQEELPLLLTVGPSITMSMVMLASLSFTISNAIQGGNTGRVVASAFMAGGMLLGALLWPTLIRKHHKKKLIEKEKYRKQRYSAYIGAIEDKLIFKTERSIHLMNDVLNPAPKQLCASFNDEASKLRLWERSIGEDDFLDVRLGLGSRPFSVNIKIPKQGFKLYDDEMAELPPKLLEKYGTLDNVPLALDLFSNRCVGIIGDKSNMENILNEIILNIISLHSYDEVKLVFITTPEQKVLFERFKNVPHTWSNNKQVRYFATNIEETHYISSFIEEILQERENDKESQIRVPHFIFIITEQSLIERESLSRYLNNPYNNVGITTIFAYGDITILPKTCTTVIHSDAEKSGYYIKNENKNCFIPFVPDMVDIPKLDAFTNYLTNMPVKRDAKQMGIVDRVSFLQMYKAGNVNDLCIEQHWDNNNSAKTLAAPIGVMAGGQIFSLDIHESYHGCHGLVAGTTGSGKSEFLQAFVLSLAINYSPREIAFVLVDFKGGDMARPFMAKANTPAMPHLSATISNLSGNLLYRALVSLEAEIKSRQRTFNKAAAALGIDKLDINSYHKYYKSGKLVEPLPHLVIIIDEFAQLKTQQPEFLAQLVNVAQVGRSLGIHLILATQKPSGIVDPQIMSNSRFKVCLKVAEKQDSMDMINRPDSAIIKNPGRLNLLVGYNEIYETVQSGFSGADYVPLSRFIPEEEITVELIDNTANPIHSARLNLAGEKTGKTQLEAVVSSIVKLGQKKNLKVKPLWLDMLPEVINFSTLELGNKGLATVTLGMVDYVRAQEQKPLTVDLVKNGHIGLYGVSGTGKTTFIQTLVYSMVKGYGYTPEELNIYAMDFGGRNLGYLKNLPHTGCVAFADESSKVTNIVATLQEIIDERKQVFSASNCGTFSEYRSIGHKLPSIVVFIDNYSSFRDKYMDESERIVEIIAAGKTYGVFFVITSSTRNGIHYKVVEHISAFYALKLNDKSHYLDILNVRPPITPENICGRGITVINKEVVEFQIALVSSGNNEAERLENIVDEYQELKHAWQGYKPIAIDESSDVAPKAEEDDKKTAPITRSYAVKQQQPKSVEGSEHILVLAASKSGALKFGIDLDEKFKTSVLADDIGDLRVYFAKIIASISTFDNRRIVLLDNELKHFEDICDMHANCQYLSSVQDVNVFIGSIKAELNDRLDGTDKCKERLFIIIPEFNGFFNMITNEQADFVRKLVKYINQPKYGVQFFTGYNVQSDKLLDRSFHELIVNAQNSIVGPGAYEAAAEKLEKMPAIYGAKRNSAYFTIDDCVAEIRW